MVKRKDEPATPAFSTVMTPDTCNLQDNNDSVDDSASEGQTEVKSNNWDSWIENFPFEILFDGK